MTTENYEKILETVVTDLLGKMGFTPAVSVEKVAEETVCRVTLAEDQNFLIGKLGMNLAAIQHLVRILARRKTGEMMRVTVDINDYFAGKKKLLEKEAAQALAEALEKNASVALRPMQAHERKVVHAYLAHQAGVLTESVGYGDERRIMVRPRSVTALDQSVS